MNWKFVRYCALLLFVFVLSAQPIMAAGKSGKTEKIKVTFVSADLVENNHVGNEWWSSGFVDGQEIEAGESVTLKVKSTGSIKLQAEAQEQDKIPEEGKAKATLKVSTLKATQNKSLSVTVTENRGRYSGNTATWKFVFTIEKVK